MRQLWLTCVCMSISAGDQASLAADLGFESVEAPPCEAVKSIAVVGSDVFITTEKEVTHWSPGGRPLMVRSSGEVRRVQATAPFSGLPGLVISVDPLCTNCGDRELSFVVPSTENHSYVQATHLLPQIPERSVEEDPAVVRVDVIADVEYISDSQVLVAGYDEKLTLVTFREAETIPRPLSVPRSVGGSNGMYYWREQNVVIVFYYQHVLVVDPKRQAVVATLQDERLTGAPAGIAVGDQSQLKVVCDGGWGSGETRVDEVLLSVVRDGDTVQVSADAREVGRFAGYIGCFGKIEHAEDLYYSGYCTEEGARLILLPLADTVQHWAALKLQDNAVRPIPCDGELVAGTVHLAWHDPVLKRFCRLATAAPPRR